eukprot:TRINITY_DN36439_c0_g1_i2.p1 TRINITY_DN36439_c0_g1~~TRINITY_DN36439_c0_g1_i2.p1  ORF type:complete len:813 (-),score=199.62 TRINITY_DN36439_c0_g1_i2:218-2656(-)
MWFGASAPPKSPEGCCPSGSSAAETQGASRKPAPPVMVQVTGDGFQRAWGRSVRERRQAFEGNAANRKVEPPQKVSAVPLRGEGFRTGASSSAATTWRPELPSPGTSSKAPSPLPSPLGTGRVWRRPAPVAETTSAEQQPPWRSLLPGAAPVSPRGATTAVSPRSSAGAERGAAFGRSAIADLDARFRHVAAVSAVERLQKQAPKLHSVAESPLRLPEDGIKVKTPYSVNQKPTPAPPAPVDEDLSQLASIAARFPAAPSCSTSGWQTPKLEYSSEQLQSRRASDAVPVLYPDEPVRSLLRVMPEERKAAKTAPSPQEAKNLRAVAADQGQRSVDTAFREASRRRVQEAAGESPVVFAVGCGGVEELAQHWKDGSVSWALLRFQIGSGTFSRTKLVSVLMNCENAPALLRGQLTARGAEVLNLFGDTHASLQVTENSTLTADYLCERLLPLFAADNLDYSPWELVKEYRNMVAQAKEAEERRTQQRTPAELQSSPTPEPKAQAEAAAPTEIQDEPKVSGGEAVRQVGSDRAATYNWVLLEPTQFDFHSAGYGGLEEMRRSLAEDMVLFGVLRLSFGECRPLNATGQQGTAHRITKFVFVHWVGPKISLVKRGKWNGKLQQAAQYIGAHCAVTFRRMAHRQEDLCLEELVLELRRLTVIDAAMRSAGPARISVQAYLTALEEETKAREEAKKAQAQAQAKPPQELGALSPCPVDAGAEASPATPSKAAVPEPPKICLRKAVQTVRTTSGSWNWVLCGMASADAAARKGLPGSPCRPPAAEFLEKLNAIATPTRYAQGRSGNRGRSLTGHGPDA